MACKYRQSGAARLQVAGASKEGVEAGGIALGRRGAHYVLGRCHLVLADQLCQAACRVIGLDEKARSVRVMSLWHHFLIFSFPEPSP